MSSTDFVLAECTPGDPFHNISPSNLVSIFRDILCKIKIYDELWAIKPTSFQAAQRVSSSEKEYNNIIFY
jgi:hypothetical protein